MASFSQLLYELRNGFNIPYLSWLTICFFCQAQTPQQRRANAKFAKDNEARMGKSEEQIKKRTKDTPKSPISPIWLGE